MNSSITLNAELALLEINRRIATDIGRLRRTTTPDSSAWWALDRIANNLETIDNIVQPTAAELYRDYLCISGDHHVSAEEALRAVDARVASLHELLGAHTTDRTLALVAA